MEKLEPELKPEWLRSNGFSSGNAGLSNNHPSTSPRSDGHGKGVPSRSKLSAVDRERSLSSNSRRSLGSNSSRSQNRDSSGKSRAYSSFGSFGRSSREKERGRDFELHDRESRPYLARNGFHDPLDIFSPILHGDKLRRSRSVSDRPSDAGHKGLGISLNNGGVSRRTVNGVSFEREFPSLGAEERSGIVGGGRVPSPPSSTSATQSISKTTVSIRGVESWNSKLVEIPVTPGTNGTDSLSTPQTAPVSQSSATLSFSTGLNMAETVAQAPSRARTPPQSSIDIQRIEEHTLRQASKLIPLTATMSKSSASISSDKLKNKGGRNADSGAMIKPGHQLSSQPLSPVLRAHARSDIKKPSQLGNFQILNREKNGVSSTVKDAANAGNVVGPVGLGPSASSFPLKNPTNQKLKTDTKGSVFPTPQGLFGENKLHSQAKDKHDFFNQLRNKTMNSSGACQESGMPLPPTVGDSGELSDFGNSHEKDDALSSNEPKSPENQPDAFGESEGSVLLDEEVDPDAGPVDPEEEAFLRSLGWDRNAEVSLLTEEEIQDFNMKYKSRKPDSKLP